MSHLRLFWLMTCFAHAACQVAPSKVIFEIPQGITGAIVIRRDGSASDGWRKSGDALLLEIKGATTLVRSFDKIEGKYLKYEARIDTRTVVPFVTMVAARTHEGMGFFGGVSTSNGEMHFYLGNASEAIDYFDRLAGK